MDKAGWHTAGELRVPENLSLVFLPPYSPELNPIERLWLHLRDNRLFHCVFQTTEEIVNSCCEAWNWLLTKTGRIRSLFSYHETEPAPTVNNANRKVRRVATYSLCSTALG